MKFRRRPTATPYLLIALASVAFSVLHPNQWVQAESEAVVLAQVWTEASPSE